MTSSRPTHVLFLNIFVLKVALILFFRMHVDLSPFFILEILTFPVNVLLIIKISPATVLNVLSHVSLKKIVRNIEKEWEEDRRR